MFVIPCACGPVGGLLFSDINVKEGRRIFQVDSGLVMVNIGQRTRDAIPRVDFNAPVGTPAGVEVMSLSEFWRRGAGRLTTPQRPDFHDLIATVSGTLKHEVDFTACNQTPGTWLWVRPGQVQRWGDLSEVEGHLVLFDRDFLDPATVVATRLETPGSPVQYNAADDPAVDLAIEHLRHEFSAVRASPLDVHIATLRHLLSVLVLRLHPPGRVGFPALRRAATRSADSARRSSVTSPRPIRSLTTPERWATPRAR